MKSYCESDFFCMFTGQKQSSYPTFSRDLLYYPWIGFFNSHYFGHEQLRKKIWIAELLVLVPNLIDYKISNMW